MSKRVGSVYVDPLPYRLGQLPVVVLHNPLSYIYYLWCYWRAPQQPKIQGRVVPSGVVVSDSQGAARLWSAGFFGKGTLSRSEPSWFGRTARSLGLDGGDLSFEELTEQRRRKRRAFKRERAQKERDELNKKLQKEGKPIQPLEPLLAEDEEPQLTEEIKALAIEDPTKFEGKTIPKLEELHLMPCEAVFLSLGLGVLDFGLSVQETLAKFCRGGDLRLYVVYHYLRSQGWCVRSGVKFGTDFIVYKQGPPFQHAHFAVMVMSPEDQPDWWWQQGVSRVVGAVRKSLVMCYVVGDVFVDLDAVTTVAQFRRVLEGFQVRSVGYSRWSPTKTRD